MKLNTESQNLPEKRETPRGVRHAEKHSENPFMQGAETLIKGKKKHYNVFANPAMAIDTKTGEVLGGIEHKVVKMVDDAQFVKVFADGIAGIYDLGRSGARVFRYLFAVVQEHPNVDRIYLHFMDAVEEPWEIPKTTFFKGMAELIEKNFIAASDRPNMYYLNPAMLWNGDRFRFVQEFVKAKRIHLVRDPNTVDFITGKTDAEND